MGRKPTMNERNQAAIDRFSAAAQGHDQAELHDATGDLLEAFADTVQRQVTRAVALLIEEQAVDRKRLTGLEQKLALHQRHLQQIDLILDELARARAVGE